MAAEDWNFRLPADPQDYPWDCAACSIAWCMRSVGHMYTEQDVIYGLGPSRISSTYGLLDASGAGLVEYLGEVGITAENNANATWGDVVGAAGYQPLAIGGRRWYHWTAVRMGGPCAGIGDVGTLALMNPADGWMGVGQCLSQSDFDWLGPFSAVWLTAW